MQTKPSLLKYLIIVICLGLILPPLLLAESPDYPDSISGAGDNEIAVPSTTDGYLEYKFPFGDNDYFKIVVSSQGTLTIYSESTAPLDPAGSLYALIPSTTLWGVLASNDDKNNGDNPLDFEIVQPVDPGTYYIQAYSGSNTQGDYTLHVQFSGSGAVTHTITAGAGSGGSISPAGTASVADGGTQSFTIAPNACYTVQDVLVDGVSVGAVAYYTFSNVTSDHTISASFASAGVFSISASPGSGGSIAPSGSVSVSCGASKSFTISPSAGYEILDVKADGVSVGAVTSYTFSNVTANHTISASFNALSNYTITTSAGSGGSISPVGPVSVASGGSQSFTITADSGYQVQDVLIDGVSVGVVHFYAFSNVIADHTLAAQFESTGVPPSPDDCIEISDTPLDARFQPAPPSIMFVLDDSGSMDWEVMTSESDGTFAGKYYVFDDPGDNVYSTSLYSSNYMSSIDRKKWKSQWSGDNRMYYNPQTIYAPWPTMGPADTATPRSHPYHASPTFNLAADYVDTGSALLPGISITNAHYYTWDDANKNRGLDSGEAVYLVNFVDYGSNGTLDNREWYQFQNDGDGVVETTELMPVMELQVPDSVRPMSFGDDLQNFANWYSYYRRRVLTATAAVARVIAGARGMQTGLYGINESVNEPVRKIDVNGVDETDTLLEILYRDYNSSLVGTPLRAGLKNVGRYFHQDDGSDGGVGPSPFAADNGSECMQAFAIVMTDGYYNGLTFSFTNADGDNGAPYADSYSSTLADAAMHYYENDLSASLDDSVPTSERDDATHQHMVTYGVGFGVTGTLNPDDFDSNPAHADFLKDAQGSYPNWPNPSNGDPEKIDDLYHASVNGRGQFLTASKPLDLINSLMLVLKAIKISSGSASSVSVNGDKLYTQINNNTLLFQSKYYSKTWHGDVLAYKVDGVTGELVKPAIWSAAYNLSNQTADNLKIATYDGTSAGQPFRFNDLTNHQKERLDANWQTDDSLAKNIVDYLRGDSSNETGSGGGFRDRSWSIVDADHPYNGTTISSSKLGDVVHSSPVYENGVVYAGGNDGMLHAFEATTGEELFSYVPNLVFENLASLTNPDYAHKYFVDLTPTIRKGAGLLEGKPPSTATDGHTILVGGLGKGGKGYYALDISNVKPLEGSLPPNENSVAALVMWEYPNIDTPATDVADMGYSFSRVSIVQSNDVDDAPWVVISGNGYNSPNGHAVLLILDPVTGQLLKKIDTQAGSCNGLSTPVTVDVNYDRKVDYVYAGDLKGNLWKFDLTDSDYNNWDLAYSEDATPKPLFTTPNQPITIKPDVIFHCLKEGYMVLFGTGKYLGENDLTDTSPQAIYGIWDFGDDADDGEYVGDFSGIELTGSNLPDTASLFHQTIDETTVDGVKFRAIDKGADEEYTAPSWSTTDQDPNGVGDHPDPDATIGWYLDLPAGERVVSDVVARDGKLQVDTYVPNDSLCSSGGNSWLMVMNACNGAETIELNIDINGDSAINYEDMVPIEKSGVSKLMVPAGMQFSGHVQSPAIIIMGNGQERLYMSNSNGQIETVSAKAAKLGITYWRVYRP